MLFQLLFSRHYCYTYYGKDKVCVVNTFLWYWPNYSEQIKTKHFQQSLYWRMFSGRLVFSFRFSTVMYPANRGYRRVVINVNLLHLFFKKKHMENNRLHKHSNPLKYNIIYILSFEYYRRIIVDWLFFVFIFLKIINFCCFFLFRFRIWPSQWISSVFIKHRLVRCCIYDIQFAGIFPPSNA